VSDLDTEIQAKFPTATSATPDLAVAYNAFRDTILAVLELHGSYDTDPCLKLEDGAWWSPDQFKHCPTVVLIAEGLRIEL